MGKASVLTLSLTSAAVLTNGCGRQDKPAESFVIEVMNGYTPVKDQGRSQTCWAYAMLSTIETEHIMRGDSVHLSVAFAVRAALADDATAHYLTSGHQPLSARGTARRLLNTIMTHGIVPYDAYRNGDKAGTKVMGNRLKRMTTVAVNTRSGLERYAYDMQRLFDESIGPAPRNVFMLGAEYTPQEFARSVCAPGEYEALTSFTHHPFYSRFALEVPDNRERSTFLNVPIDTLMTLVEKAVRSGRGVCWEGDISEPGFSFADGVARLPRHAHATQTARQREFESFRTTDDHCMAIVGIARDKAGGKYFVMKNSWGTGNPYGGLMYVSEQYVRMKTIAVYLPKSLISF